MFWNIYSKRILGFVRNRDTIIWTWAFPLLLGTLFYAVFTNLDSAGQFREIPIAVVDDAAYRQDAALQAAIGSVSGAGRDGNWGERGDDGGGWGNLFDLSYAASQGEADAMLEKGEIEGYIAIGTDSDPMLAVSGNGMGQTIAKGFLDSYLQTKKGIEQLMSQEASQVASPVEPQMASPVEPQAEPQIVPQEAPRSPGAAGYLPALPDAIDYTEMISLSANPPTDKANYFYALLAMVCLYGGFQGLTTMTQLQANLSPLGARRTIAPVGRFRMVAYDLLGGITVQYMCLLMVVAYINFVLGVSFGPKLWLVLLTCLAGSVLGVAFGAMVSVISKLKEQAKVAILITATMVCCFLSGLMVGGINYAVAQNAPAAAWLNPAARITDAFYCLYYYDTYGRYFLNIGIILAMAAAMLAVTSVFIRRQRYESI